MRFNCHERRHHDECTQLLMLTEPELLPLIPNVHGAGLGTSLIVYLACWWLKVLQSAESRRFVTSRWCRREMLPHGALIYMV